MRDPTDRSRDMLEAIAAGMSKVNEPGGGRTML